MTTFGRRTEARGDEETQGLAMRPTHRSHILHFEKNNETKLVLNGKQRRHEKLSGFFLPLLI